MSVRNLEWKPIENAPSRQTVLIWAVRASAGTFHKGYVVQSRDGGYEVFDEEGFIIFGATHYAIVEGP